MLISSDISLCSLPLHKAKGQSRASFPTSPSVKFKHCHGACDCHLKRANARNELSVGGGEG